jgi:hypothetical protein
MSNRQRLNKMNNNLSELESSIYQKKLENINTQQILYKSNVNNDEITNKITNNKEIKNNNLSDVTNKISGQELIIKIKSNVKDKLLKNIEKKKKEEENIYKKYPLTRGLMMKKENIKRINELKKNISNYELIIKNIEQNIEIAQENINLLEKKNSNIIIENNTSTISSKSSFLEINKINKERLNTIQQQKINLKKKLSQKEKDLYNLVGNKLFFNPLKKMTLEKNIKKIKDELNELNKKTSKNREKSKK